MVNKSANTQSNSAEEDTPLTQLIFQTLSKNSERGTLRFDHYMDLALYHPQHGYYSSSIDTKIGRKGDFYTSVSVGDTFGLLLSHAIEKKWASFPSKTLTLIEQGGHDGRLARDIIDALRERESPLLEGLKYYLVEPKENNRKELEELFHLTGYTESLYPVKCLSEARCEEGIFLCNELLDAFSVRRFVRESGAWMEQYVTNEEGLTLGNEPIAESDLGFQRFESLSAPFVSELPDGYTTEFCESLGSWMEECSSLFSKRGLWWVIDYGFEAARYFEPNRNRGTLKCYSGHKTHEAPLWLPGRCDISAHVNFTHLLEEAESLGLSGEIFDQSRFLTKAAESWLLSLEGQLPEGKTAERLRQFQTLTHPSMMGQSFQVVELHKGC